MPDDDTLTSAATDTGAQDSAQPAPATDTPTPPTPDAGAQPTQDPPGPASDLASEQRGQQTDTPPNPETQATPAINWEERYKNLQSYADRRNMQYTKHLEELQRKQAELAQQVQERAAVAQAKPWQKTHPEHGKFNGMLAAAKTIHRQLQALDQSPIPPGADPEHHAQQVMFAKQQIMAGLGGEEQKALAEYQQSLQDWQQKLFTEPEDAIRPFVETAFERMFAAKMAEQEGRQAVEHDFQQPHLQPLLKDPKYAGYLKERLDSGVPYEYAMEMLKLRAVADLASTKFQNADRMATHAQEQVRLAQGRSSRTTTADPATAPTDPYRLALKDARERGITPGSPEFNRLIDKYTH
jgi:hypothetical protein